MRRKPGAILPHARRMSFSRSSYRSGAGELHALLWQRAREPFAGAWALPGGTLGPDETLERLDPAPSRGEGRRPRAGAPRAARLLSDPARNPAVPRARDRVPRPRAGGRRPEVPEDTAWHAVDELPELAFDHREIVLAGRERLRAKLSYTNVGFALAPPSFTLSELRELYAAALGHDVSATNLKRVLLRRGVLEETGDAPRAGPRRGPTRLGLPLPLARARDHRPVRDAPAARLTTRLVQRTVHGSSAYCLPETTTERRPRDPPTHRPRDPGRDDRTGGGRLRRRRRRERGGGDDPGHRRGGRRVDHRGQRRAGLRDQRRRGGGTDTGELHARGLETSRPSTTST